MALMHKPKVLLLDELFEGIYLASSAVIEMLLGQLSSDGATILLTSHILSIVQKIATRVVILHQGRVESDFNPSTADEGVEEVYFSIVGNHSRRCRIGSDPSPSVLVEETDVEGTEQLFLRAFQQLPVLHPFYYGRGFGKQDTESSILEYALLSNCPPCASACYFFVDTQHRLPPERVATWPLTRTQRLLLSSVSFALNPLFIVLFFGYLFWMGLAAGLFFVLLALIVHGTVYAVGRLPFELRTPAGLNISRTPLKVGGIAQEMWRELQGTLDFWTALLIAVSGTLYRLFGRAPEPEAFPMLSLFVGIAMSTIGQRMLRLDEGQALLRYRLLPIAGWKLLVTQDMTFLIPLAVMVSLLSLRTGIAFGLVAIAVGRYPSLRQRANQRRWRFVGGDPRFGVAQVLLGGLAGLGAARMGLWVLAVAFALYVVSIFWGEQLWKCSLTA